MWCVYSCNALMCCTVWFSKDFSRGWRGQQRRHFASLKKNGFVSPELWHSISGLNLNLISVQSLSPIVYHIFKCEAMVQSPMGLVPYRNFNADLHFGWLCFEACVCVCMCAWVRMCVWSCVFCNYMPSYRAGMKSHSRKQTHYSNNFYWGKLTVILLKCKL